MENRPSVELVVASFDDPIVTGLRVEHEAEPAARFGTRSGSAGGSPPADTGIVYLVAREPGGLVGCAGLRRLGDDAAEVRHVYVRPEYRGLGVSRLLLDGVEDLARRRGFTFARLAADGAREAGMFESRGYVRTGPFGAHPAHAVCLEKALRA